MEQQAPGLAEFLTSLTSQCASLEELRLALRPQMDPRWVVSGNLFSEGVLQKELVCVAGEGS